MSIDVVYLHTFSSKKPAKNNIKKWKNSFEPKSFFERESLCVLLSRKKELQNVIITLNELLQVVLTRHDISWQLIVFKKRIWRECRVLETKKTIYWCALYFLYNILKLHLKFLLNYWKKSQYMYIVNDISKLFSSFHIPQNVHCITCWTKMAKRFLIFLFLWIIGYSSMKKITQLGWPFFYSVGNCEEWLCYCHFFSLPCLTDRIYSCEEKKTFCKVPLDHYSSN